MALKIRMKQQGRTNRPFYRLVVTESRNPRDGKYVECIGWYNPCEEDAEKELSIKPDRLQHWLDRGAILSESVEQLAKKAAPTVLKALQEKKLAAQAKKTAARRERRRALAKAAS